MNGMPFGRDTLLIPCELVGATRERRVARMSRLRPIGRPAGVGSRWPDRESPAVQRPDQAQEAG